MSRKQRPSFIRVTDSSDSSILCGAYFTDVTGGKGSVTTPEISTSTYCMELEFGPVMPLGERREQISIFFTTRVFDL